jgi:hypothetical protein
MKSYSLRNNFYDIDEALSDRDQDKDTNNGTFRRDPSEQQNDLVKKILPEKLAKYSKFNQYRRSKVSRPRRRSNRYPTEIPPPFLGSQISRVKFPPSPPRQDPLRT